jgi:hypothetical protein
MSSHSTEFPIVIGADEVDEADHVSLREPLLAWDALAVVLAFAFVSLRLR